MGELTSGEEIRSSLSWSWFETKIDKVLAGAIGGPKIRHASFVNDTNFVKPLIQRFPRLIKGNDCREAIDVRNGAQCTNELQGSGRI